MAHPAGQNGNRSHLSSQQQTDGGRIALVVALSMITGVIIAIGLVAMPILPAEEQALTGAVLLGLASGWAILAVLSVRLTSQPQRWAAAPATFLAVAGIVTATGSVTVRTVLGWVWPPALALLVVWMVLRIRRQLHSRVARWLLYPAVAVLAVAAIGGGYETVREALDARAYPPPGRLVDVGGHRLHLHCTGSGSPTVVLEPGLGASSADMGWIAPVVARDTTVCVYDRAGRGWSDPADGPQDGDQVAADLHTLLAEADVDGPYVLAGHSFGGLYVLDFAAQFPDQVAGLVLLDSTAPRPGPAVQTSDTSSTMVDRVVALVPAMAHLGAGRILAHLAYDSLPPRTLAEARANASTSRHLASLLQEELAGAASVRQAAALTGFDGKPLLVLTADTGHDASWQSQQNHLATLSSNSLHRIATDTTHVSMLEDQADSAAASAAVQDVVAAVRGRRDLPAR